MLTHPQQYHTVAFLATVDSSTVEHSPNSATFILVASSPVPSRLWTRNHLLEQTQQVTSLLS